MTDKIALTNIVDLTNETTAVNSINNNNNTIAAAFDNTLSRDGTQPNAMEATLDMNSNPIINLPAPSTNFSPLRMIDAETLNGGGTITIQPLPTGGTTGQVLEKNSNANFDVSWQTISSSGGTAVPVYNTLADAQSSFNASSITSIVILRKQAGWPLANAPYVRGTVSGPNAFQDALGNYWQVDVSGNTINASWFWAGGGGDDTSALQKAVNVCIGKTLNLGSLAYNISSSIVIPSCNGIVIRGDNYNNCSITISGSNEITTGMLSGPNVGGITIEGITFNGNSISTTVSASGAIFIGNDNTNVLGNLGHVNIFKCKFYNFKQDRWIGIVQNNVATTSLGPVRIHDCSFLSVAGNSRSYTDFNNGSTMVYVWGSTSNLTGGINNVEIMRNNVDGTGVMCFNANWENIGTWNITDNFVKENARGLTATANAYTFLNYTPIGLTLNGGGIFSRNRCFNTIFGGGYIGPGCHLYCAQTGPVIATDNQLSNITRTDNVTLRRAAISLNGVGASIVKGNTLRECSTGIAISGSADQLVSNYDVYTGTSLNLGQHVITCNQISSNAGSPVGFNISWQDSGTFAPYVALLNNVLNLTAGTKSIKTPGTFGTINEINSIP